MLSFSFFNFCHFFPLPVSSLAGDRQPEGTSCELKASQPSKSLSPPGRQVSLPFHSAFTHFFQLLSALVTPAADSQLCRPLDFSFLPLGLIWFLSGDWSLMDTKGRCGFSTLVLRITRYWGWPWSSCFLVGLANIDWASFMFHTWALHWGICRSDWSDCALWSVVIAFSPKGGLLLHSLRIWNNLEMWT